MVDGDDRNGPRMAEFVLGDANEQTGPSTRPMNRDSRSQSSRRYAIVVVKTAEHRPSYEPAIHGPRLGQFRVRLGNAVDALVDPR